MAIRRVEVRLLRLALREPFAAAHGEVGGDRPLVVVRVDADEGSGWGECEALPEPGYTDEWAAGAFTAIATELAPRLPGLALDPVVAGLALAGAGGRPGVGPMALAALEQAVLDAVLRAARRSLAEHLGATAADVRAGAVVGLAADVDVVVARVGALVAEGYGRVKVKIRPGWDVEPLRALRAAFPALELQADANGSYRVEDAPALAALDDLGLTCLEQPLPAPDLAGAARLRSVVGTPVAADESAWSAEAVSAVLAAAAADVVVVKPARLGGLAAAAAVHERCRQAGVALLAGGLLEAGLGRRALAAVAALPGFTVTGDCSPASRWLAGDPWPEEALVGGRLTLHDGPGIAPPPDPDLLDAATTARVVLAPT